VVEYVRRYNHGELGDASRPREVWKPHYVANSPIPHGFL
jgi:hypothetical protein